MWVIAMLGIRGGHDVTGWDKDVKKISMECAVQSVGCERSGRDGVEQAYLSFLSGSYISMFGPARGIAPNGLLAILVGGFSRISWVGYGTGR